MGEGSASRGRLLFFLKNKFLLRCWTSPRIMSSLQVAGKQTRHAARPASTLRPHTHAPSCSHPPGTTSRASWAPLPIAAFHRARFFPLAAAYTEHHTEGHSAIVCWRQHAAWTWVRSRPPGSTFTSCAAPESPWQLISAVHVQLR